MLKDCTKRHYWWWPTSVACISLVNGRGAPIIWGIPGCTWVQMIVQLCVTEMLRPKLGRSFGDGVQCSNIICRHRSERGPAMCCPNESRTIAIPAFSAMRAKKRPLRPMKVGCISVHIGGEFRTLLLCLFYTKFDELRYLEVFSILHKLAIPPKISRFLENKAPQMPPNAVYTSRCG